MIDALGYVLIGTPDIPGWLRMATAIAGLQADEVDPGRTVRLRMDGKVQRLLLQGATGKPTLGMGYTVAGPEVLETAVRKVEDAGFAVTPSTPEERALRGVTAMAHFRDPDGYRVELPAVCRMRPRRSHPAARSAVFAHTRAAPTWASAIPP